MLEVVFRGLDSYFISLNLTEEKQFRGNQQRWPWLSCPLSCTRVPKCSTNWFPKESLLSFTEVQPGVELAIWNFYIPHYSIPKLVHKYSNAYPPVTGCIRPSAGGFMVLPHPAPGKSSRTGSSRLLSEAAGNQSIREQLYRTTSQTQQAHLKGPAGQRRSVAGWSQGSKVGAPR